MESSPSNSSPIRLSSLFFIFLATFLGYFYFMEYAQYSPPTRKDTDNLYIPSEHSNHNPPPIEEQRELSHIPKAEIVLLFDRPQRQELELKAEKQLRDSTALTRMISLKELGVTPRSDSEFKEVWQKNTVTLRSEIIQLRKDGLVHQFLLEDLKKAVLPFKTSNFSSEELVEALITREEEPLQTEENPTNLKEEYLQRSSEILKNFYTYLHQETPKREEK